MNVEILTGAPGKRGRYGRYGGKFVPETLMVALAAWGTSPVKGGGMLGHQGGAKVYHQGR